VAAAQAEAAEKAELARRAAADAAEAAKAAKAARARADEAARAAAAIDFDDWTSEAEVSRQASNIAVDKGNNTLDNCDDAVPSKSLKRARVE
jgi:membrane protein involved in colicin uptake